MSRRAWCGRAVAVLILAPLGAACTVHDQPTDPSPSDVVRSLGAVPIATAPSAQATPQVVVGRPALLAIGGPVHVDLAGGVDADATALGPDQTISDPEPNATGAARPKSSTSAVISLRIAVHHGRLNAAASELSSRDETGRLIPLTASGPASVQVGAGTVQTLRLVGTFDSGAAQVTWRHAGHVLAIWTFNIELD